MTAKLICVRAVPSVRNLCPPDMIEGRWMEVPGHAQEIQAFGQAAAETQEELDEAEVTRLIARSNGKFARRDDLVSAPVWEMRHEDDWPRRADDSLRLYGE